MLISQYIPNSETKHFTTAVATWVLLGINATTRVLTGYATLAALQAAGDLPFPGLQGTPIQYCLLKCENGLAADGSGFYYRKGGTIAPASDDEGMFISGAGQAIQIACPVWLLWVRKATAGDELMIEIGW